MKREHFDHVCDYFDLVQYTESNRNWSNSYNEASVNTMIIGKTCFIDKFEIMTRNMDDAYVFIMLPTEELAEEILQYMKDTEMLFV